MFTVKNKKSKTLYVGRKNIGDQKMAEQALENLRWVRLWGAARNDISRLVSAYTESDSSRNPKRHENLAYAYEVITGRDIEYTLD